MNKVYTIGRAKDNDLVIESKNVSNHHALLKDIDGTLILEDNNSSNGVWVNNRRISASEINFLDKIFLAETEFNLKKYLKIEGDKIKGIIDQNDTSQLFGRLKKIEQEFETEKDAINKLTGKNMIYFRISVIAIMLIGMSRAIFPNLSSVMQYLIPVIIIVAAASIYFYVQAMEAGREKEKQRKLAKDKYKLKFVCPTCDNFINDSASLIEMKQEYKCKYCKTLIYKKPK